MAWVRSGQNPALCFDPDPIMPFKANAGRRHYIPKQKRKVINWAAYDASLRQRGSLTVSRAASSGSICNGR